jgi:hypothetical protein
MRWTSLFSLFGMQRGPPSLPFPINTQLYPIAQLHSQLLNNVNVIHTYKDILYGKNNSCLQQDIFTGEQFQKIRTVQFTYGNRSMFHSLWYPCNEYNAPILSIDFVKFEENPMRSLLFTNVYDYEKSEGSQFVSRIAFRTLLQNFPEFKEKKTKHLAIMDPILREETMLYSHIYNSTKLEKGMQLLQYYFDAYLNTCLYCGFYKNASKRDADFNRVRLSVEEDFSIYKDLFPASDLKAFLERGFD